MFRRSLIPVLLILVLFAPADVIAQGCAMCKAVVENGSTSFGGEQAVGRGLNTGILYLMVIPYLMLLLIFRKRIAGFIREFASAQG